MGFNYDNSTRIQTYIRNNSFLASGKGLIDDISDKVGTEKKKEFNIIFTKAKVKLYFSIHYSGDNSYLIVNGKTM